MTNKMHQTFLDGALPWTPRWGSHNPIVGWGGGYPGEW